jgi:mono/diheme cytochrome c family protein
MRGPKQNPVKVTAVVVLAVCCSLRAEEKKKPEKIDFTRVIKPLLESSCVKCHGADRFHGDLRLDTKELALASFGEMGRLLVPGKPLKSTLYTTSILPDEDPVAMPLRDRDKLTKEQTEQLRLWIEQDADWPEDVTLKRIDKVFFSMVASVFQRSCLKCHAKDKAEAGVRLDNRKDAFKGGKKGATIVPFDPAASSVFTSLASPSVHDKNPPRLLSDEDIGFIKEWIRQGAVWPEDMESISNDTPHEDSSVKKK